MLSANSDFLPNPLNEKNGISQTRRKLTTAARMSTTHQGLNMPAMIDDGLALQ